MRDSAAFLLALILPGVSAAACDEKVLPDLTNRYMAASLSPACDKDLEALGAPPGWLRECKRGLIGPNANYRRQFALRSSFRFTGLTQVGDLWLGEGVLQHPDPHLYLAEVDRRLGCDGWTDYRSPNATCDPIDWDRIPMTEIKSGAVFTCESNKWRVHDVD